MSQMGRSRRFCDNQSESAFTPNSGAITDIAAVRVRADSVEKACLPTRCNFFRAVGFVS